MKDYREIILDRRTKIIKDNNPIFIVYKMMRKIPYRSCIGTMRYRWFEVSRVYGDVLVGILNERASKNMRKRRLSMKGDNLLNPKLW